MQPDARWLIPQGPPQRRLQKVVVYQQVRVQQGTHVLVLILLGLKGAGIRLQGHRAADGAGGDDPVLSIAFAPAQADHVCALLLLPGGLIPPDECVGHIYAGVAGPHSEEEPGLGKPRLMVLPTAHTTAAAWSAS